LLCIVLTAAKVMPVANVAHGVGAALGAMLGWTATAQSARARIGHVALLAGSVAAIAVAGSVGRPYVNLAGRAGDDYEAAALDALQNGRYSRAIELYRKALAINAHEPRWWHNLGVACFRADRLEEALEAFRRAAELAPMDPKHQAALSAMTGQMSEEAGQPGANAQGESPSGR
jgi:tetratricopeptide (TPR) repeat protein